MATERGVEHTAGVLPSVNDMVAAVVLLAVYLVRIGHVVEGVPVPLWLSLTTDFLVPACAAAWLLVVPVYRVVMYVRG